MTMTLAMITCNTTDAPALAAWWAEQTGGAVAHAFGDDYVVVVGDQLPVRLAFQRVDDPTPGRNKFHLDLNAPDLDAEVARLVGAGATLIEERGDESFRWVTLADPDGNEFCVASADAGEF